MNEQEQVWEAYAEVLSALDPGVTIDVEQGSADYLHVVATSDQFDNMSVIERNRLPRSALRQLGPTLAIRVTVVMLLTPSEYNDIRSLAL